MIGRLFRLATGTGCPVCGGKVKMIDHDCVLGDVYVCRSCGRKFQNKL